MSLSRKMVHLGSVLFASGTLGFFFAFRSTTPELSWDIALDPWVIGAMTCIAVMLYCVVRLWCLCFISIES